MDENFNILILQNEGILGMTWREKIKAFDIKLLASLAIFQDKNLCKKYSLTLNVIVDFSVVVHIKDYLIFKDLMVFKVIFCSLQ